MGGGGGDGNVLQGQPDYKPENNKDWCAGTA